MQRLHRPGADVVQAALAALLLIAAPAGAGTLSTASATLATDSLTDTFIVFADNQGFTTNGTAPCADGSRCDDLEKTADWVCAHKADENIKAVLGVGDMVNEGQSSAQWDNFMNAHAKLVACDVPYIPTIGNHEITTGASATGIGCANIAGDATMYWTRLGIPLDSEPWFGGRGTYAEVAEAASPSGSPCGLNAFATPGSTLYEETNNTGSRSFWVRLGSRFAVISAEWEMGARMGQDAELAGITYIPDPSTTATWAWAQGVMAENRDLIFLHITHTGPCEMSSGTGCLDWVNTPDGNDGFGEQQHWIDYRDAASNAFVFMNGHTNGVSDTDGGGFFSVLTRDDGTPAIAAGFDFSSITRGHTTGAYSWQGRVLWKRGTRQVCVQTIRPIDAGGGAGVAASLVYPLAVAGTDFDRTDNSNVAETCAEIILPPSLR